MKGSASNGDYCPVTPTHGRMFELESGRQWCAHQSHDRSGTPTVYESDGKTPWRKK